MNDSFLNKMLVDPLTGEQLVFDKITNTYFCPVSGIRYPVIDSIPSIIVTDSTVAKTDLHIEFNSEFRYSDHYQKDATIFDYSEQSMSGVTKNEFARLRESIINEISNDFSVFLDVGCGNGWVSRQLVSAGKKVISMDISSVNPIKAVKEVPNINHAGLIADLYAIPLKDNSVDCIIASEVMEHVPDPKLFIIRLVKLLKNNGKLIITTPYNEKIEYYICVHCNNPTPKYAHLHSFNDENIIPLIPQTGVSWSSKRFINKYLIQIRSHIILKLLPFGLWKLTDDLFNKIFRNPTRLQIVIKKIM